MSAVRRAIVLMPLVAAAPASQGGTCEAAVVEEEESTLLQKASVKAAKMAEVKAHSKVFLLVADSFAKYPGSATTLKSQGVIDVLSMSGKQGATGGRLAWDLTDVDGRCTNDVVPPPNPDGSLNGCSIQIHEGYTCSNASEVGRDYWNRAILDSNPWRPIKYVVPQSNTTGSLTFNPYGYKLESKHVRATVVHDFDGKIIACSKITYNDQSCVPTDHVKCPGSKGQCSDNQCCPGGTVSGGKTFPCPSATCPESANCETDTQVSRCVGEEQDFPSITADDFKEYPGSSTSLKVTGKVSVKQPSQLDQLILSWDLHGVDSRCTAGAADGTLNGCSINIHEGMTCDGDKEPVDPDFGPFVPEVEYTVPESVSRGGGRVDFGYKARSAIGRAMVVHDFTGARMACSLITHSYQDCEANDHVSCPGSNSTQCAGNQCCPGVEISGGKTFPCPSAADPAEANCQTNFQVSRCER